MKVGDLVQWLPHADSPVDGGMGLVIAEGLDVDDSLVHKVLWLCDTYNRGHWYSDRDMSDIKVISESR